MSVQDVIFASGSLIFVINLIPSVLSDHKPHLATSIPTSLVLFVFSFTYLTINFWWASFTTALSATVWLILAVQELGTRGSGQPRDQDGQE